MTTRSPSDLAQDATKAARRAYAAVQPFLVPPQGFVTTPTDSDNTAKLLASANAILGALAGAIDDLNRAALILGQEARSSGQRFRTPEDMRRIADQFSDRARNSRSSYEAAISFCRDIASPLHLSS